MSHTCLWPSPLWTIFCSFPANIYLYNRFRVLVGHYVPWCEVSCTELPRFRSNTAMMHVTTRGHTNLLCLMWLWQLFPCWDNRTNRAAWLGCLRAESKRACTSRFNCWFLPRGPNGGRGMPLHVWFTLLRSSALICPRRLSRSHANPVSSNAENQCLWYTGASSESVSSLSDTSTPVTSRLRVTANVIIR